MKIARYSVVIRTHDRYLEFSKSYHSYRKSVIRLKRLYSTWDDIVDGFIYDNILNKVRSVLVIE